MQNAYYLQTYSGDYLVLPNKEVYRGKSAIQNKCIGKLYSRLSTRDDLGGKIDSDGELCLNSMPSNVQNASSLPLEHIMGSFGHLVIVAPEGDVRISGFIREVKTKIITKKHSKKK
jgi:hypothetical protein